MRGPGGEGSAGFSLVEVVVSLLLFLLAAGFAAQLLMETSQQLADAAAEQAEAPAPLVRARMRADIQAAVSAVCVRRADGSLEEVRLGGHPAGTVTYRVSQGMLWRLDSPLLGGVEAWNCADGGGLLWIELTYRRRSVRRTPLAVAPEGREGLSETRVESLLIAPRGAGLGAGW